VLSQLAIKIVTDVEQFLDQFEAASGLRDEIGPVLQASQDQITARRERGVTVLADLERLKDFEAEVTRVQRAFTSLDDLLKQAQDWVSVAKVSAARTCEAAGRIIAAESVSDLTLILGQMAQKSRSSAQRSPRRLTRSCKQSERPNT